MSQILVSTPGLSAAPEDLETGAQAHCFSAQAQAPCNPSDVTKEALAAIPDRARPPTILSSRRKVEDRPNAIHAPETEPFRA